MTYHHCCVADIVYAVILFELSLILLTIPCIIQCVPLATELGISLINSFTTNEYIATKFEADYRHVPLHFSHNERTPVQISLQCLHWCYSY